MSSGQKHVTLFELGLVWCVAFSSAIFMSTQVALSGSYRMPLSSSLYLSNAIFVEVLGLALLGYVLYRQGRSFREIGMAFRLRDLVDSFILLVLIWLGRNAFCYLLYYGYYHFTGEVLDLSFKTPATVSLHHLGLTLLLLCINPFFEELIVRGYTISEILRLGRSPFFAVMISVLLQTSYHLYYGLVVSLTLVPVFLVFSIYFLRTKRIFPVILAHGYLDLLGVAFIAYQSGHPLPH